MNDMVHISFHKLLGKYSPVGIYAVIKVIMIILLYVVSFSIYVEAQTPKVYFFVKAGVDLDCKPHTNPIIFEGENAYVYGSGSFPVSELRNNIDYFEELFSYEGHVKTDAPSGYSKHFSRKLVLNRAKSDSKFDYYEDDNGCPWRFTKDKSEMRRGDGVGLRYVNIDKNEIVKVNNSRNYSNNTNSNQGFHNQTGGYNQSIGTSGSYLNNSNHKTATQPAVREFKCAYCNGTGRIEKNDNAPASFGTQKPRQRCNDCGKWYDPNVFVHYHQQCRHCGGTGKTK